MQSQKCKNCTYYTAYYKQWSSGYGRLSNGYCSRCEKLRTQYETCENFKSNALKEKRREERLFVYLECALESINEIVQILREKENEKHSIDGP